MAMTMMMQMYLMTTLTSHMVPMNLMQAMVSMHKGWFDSSMLRDCINEKNAGVLPQAGFAVLLLSM
jgi:hypothetical protein